MAIGREFSLSEMLVLPPSICPVSLLSLGSEALILSLKQLSCAGEINDRIIQYSHTAEIEELIRKAEHWLVSAVHAPAGRGQEHTLVRSISPTYVPTVLSLVILAQLKSGLTL